MLGCVFNLRGVSSAFLVIWLVALAVPSYAQGANFEEVFGNLNEEEQLELVCSAYLEADYDVVSQINPRMTRTIPFDCGAIPAFSVLSETHELQTPVPTATYGVSIMERQNKWSFDGDSEGYITVSNPFPVELKSISILFHEGTCRPGTDGKVFEIIPERVIPPREAYVVRFDYSYLTSSGADACIYIVDADTAPLSDADENLSEAMSLAKAGLWDQAGILLDLAIRSGARVDERRMSDLHESVGEAVRSLPAEEALRNRDGYDFLLSLRPENLDYAERSLRYHAASLSEREKASMMSFLSLAPIVLIEQVAMELSEGRTRAQRDVSWDSFKGKRIELFGRVRDVQPDGLILNASLDIDIGRGLSASCYVKNFLNDAAKSVRIGDSVKCNGVLSNYTLIFGDLVLSVNDAEFSR